MRLCSALGGLLVAVVVGCDDGSERVRANVWRLAAEVVRAGAGPGADVGVESDAGVGEDASVGVDTGVGVGVGVGVGEDAGVGEDTGVGEDRGGDAGVGVGRDVDVGEGEDTVEVVPSESLRVIVFSDLNGSYGSTSYGADVHRAVARIIALQPDLAIATGDMVAGQQAGLDYRAMWAGFHDAVSEPLAGAAIPFAMTPGNHDASGYPAFTAERAIYVEQWRARPLGFTPLPGGDYPLRYAFRLGPALFVSLDATTIGPLTGAQRAWLDQTLTANPAPVKVVFGHMPLWPVAIGREDDYLGDASLEAILERHEVDVYLSGHHHAYYPGRRGALRQASLACVGSGPRPLIGTANTSIRSIIVIELDPSGITSLEAFSGATFSTHVDRATLPPSLGSGALKITRDDL